MLMSVSVSRGDWREDISMFGVCDMSSTVTDPSAFSLNLLMTAGQV